MNPDRLEQIKIEIFEKISEYYKAKGHEKFVPGKSRISYAGAIFDDREVISVVDSLLSGWFGLGSKAREFTKRFSEYLGVFKTILVNSGSSANLLALTSLTSNKLDRPIRKGEEVITPAVTFPTTVNPIIQNSLTPVLVDVDLETLNVDVERLKEAITSKSRVIMLPHTLGNPSDMDAIMEVVEDYNLYLIEDNCDALGSEFKDKKTGSFGILSTCSFYPAHHITMGEGGSVSIVEENIKLYRIIRSLRDWGRDCWCESDEKSPYGACGRRFEWVVDGMKYDHKYIYSHIGYNLKPTEMQAALGVEQIKRIEYFNSVRRRNFEYLYENLRKYEDYLILVKKHKKANPAWFAFPITVRENAPFTREDIVRYLEDKRIQTRVIFAGDIKKQPAYRDYNFRCMKSMNNADYIMRNSFFIGVYPGIDENRLRYIVDVFEAFFEGVKR